MKYKVIIGDSQHLREEDNSIHLVVTSPPYFLSKEYETNYSNYEQYLQMCYKIWGECYRVLVPGGRLCINCFDNPIRGTESIDGYHRRPTTSYFITFCTSLGYLYMGSILWRNIKSVSSTGGSTGPLGSYPYPPNGILKFNSEDIIILRKPGKRTWDPEQKEKSKLTQEEWYEYFDTLWQFSSVKQDIHPAMFPEELPRRLVKMYSFYGDTVLDPFLGSGTTMKVCKELRRNCIGYELNKDYTKIIKNKIGYGQITFSVQQDTVEFLG